MSSAAETAIDIRPFQVEIPEEELAELRRRIEATRWPSKELVADRSQGVQLATLQALARYWTTEYDWRTVRGETERVAAVHDRDRRGRHPLHPRQVAARERVAADHDARLARLGHRAARDGRPADRPDRARRTRRGRVPPGAAVLPGYGFSGEPTEVGWDPARVALAWAELMRRLGYTRYVAQGGDVGAIVTDVMGRQAPEGLVGIHTNLLVAALAVADQLPAEAEQERAALDALATFRQDGFGYFLEQATRPQTIGYALLDSPVALAAWMLDHDTDSYYKISQAFVDGEPVGNLTRDHIVDNITLYWLTGTGASAARAYWEGGRAQAAAQAAGQAPPAVSVPVGFTTFPGEVFAAPRSWAEAVYPSLAYFNEVDRGGHFAAWEEPELFAAEMRAAFSSLR